MSPSSSLSIFLRLSDENTQGDWHQHGTQLPKSRGTRLRNLHHVVNLGALAFYFALSPFAHNLGQVEWPDLFLGFAVTSAVALLMLCLARIFTSEFGRVTLIAMVLLAYFFSYRESWLLTASLQDGLGVGWLEEHRFFGLYIVLVLAPIFLLKHWPRDLKGPSVIASSVVAGLLALPVFWVLSYQTGWQSIENLSADKLREPEFQPDRQAAAGAPNVVFMVFDRYANAHMLRDRFGFDNEPFLQELQQRGFYLARDSRSNYLRTAHSLAATLSVDYLDDLAEAIGPRSRDYQPLYDRIQEATVARFLKNQGYQFFHYGSWWGPTSRMSLAEENVNVATYPEFLTLLFDRSFLSPLDRKFRFFMTADKAQCERVPFKFKALRERLVREEGPFFAFAHFLVPHRPFVFDAEGRCAYKVTGRGTSYLDQLQYANREILSLIDAVREEARRPTIIVLQADEGPYPRPFLLDQQGFDWTQATEQQLRLKTAILNAVYFPDGDYRTLTNDMTPVNTFRIIFNKYFGTRLPLLPDRTFLHRSEARLYDFQEVTDRVSWPRPMMR